MKHLIALISLVFIVSCSSNVTVKDAKTGKATTMDSETYVEAQKIEANKAAVSEHNKRVARQQEIIAASVGKPLFSAQCPPSGCVFTNLTVNQALTPEMLLAMNKHMPAMMKAAPVIKGETNWADVAVQLTKTFESIGITGLKITEGIVRRNAGYYFMYKNNQATVKELAGVLGAYAATPTSVDNSVHTSNNSEDHSTSLTAGNNIAQEGSTIREGSADISAGQDIKVNSENPVSTVTEDNSDSSQHSNSSDNSNQGNTTTEVKESEDKDDDDEEVTPPA